MTKSFRIMLLVSLLMFFTIPAFAATDAEIVGSFKEFASENISKALETYDGIHYKVAYIEPSKYSSKPNGYWFKLTGVLDPNYKIDVQKTNSLISPYIATLEVNYKTLCYYGRSTKEAAESVSNIERTSTDIYKFTVAYQDDKWVVTDAKKYSRLLGEWFNTNTKDIFEVLKCKYEKH